MILAIYFVLAIIFVVIGLSITKTCHIVRKKTIKNHYTKLYSKSVLEAYNLVPKTSNFARVRGKTTKKIDAVLHRKNFAKSDIFSRCKFCNGLKIRGVCQLCGGLDPCSWCGGVIQPNGKSRKMGYEKVKNMSHGICNSCCAIEMQKLEDDVGVDKIYPGSMSTFRGGNEIC